MRPAFLDCSLSPRWSGVGMDHPCKNSGSGCHREWKSHTDAIRKWVFRSGDQRGEEAIWQSKARADPEAPGRARGALNVKLVQRLTGVLTTVAV